MKEMTSYPPLVMQIVEPKNQQLENQYQFGLDRNVLLSWFSSFHIRMTNFRSKRYGGDDISLIY